MEYKSSSAAELESGWYFLINIVHAKERNKYI